MDNYIFPKISGSQEDNQISIFGCPYTIFGRRGHEDTRILLPWPYALAGMHTEIGKTSGIWNDVRTDSSNS